MNHIKKYRQITFLMEDDITFQKHNEPSLLAEISLLSSNDNFISVIMSPWILLSIQSPGNVRGNRKHWTPPVMLPIWEKININEIIYDFHLNDKKNVKVWGPISFRRYLKRACSHHLIKPMQIRLRYEDQPLLGGSNLEFASQFCLTPRRRLHSFSFHSLRPHLSYQHLVQHSYRLEKASHLYMSMFWWQIHELWAPWIHSIHIESHPLHKKPVFGHLLTNSMQSPFHRDLSD